MAQIQKSKRRYVAITWYTTSKTTGKPQYILACIGEPGMPKQHVQRLGERACLQWRNGDAMVRNLVVVTLSVCLRSYKGPYTVWLREHTTPAPVTVAEIMPAPALTAPESEWPADVLERHKHCGPDCPAYRYMHNL